MGKALILETTFLVDLERELARESVGPAQTFLQTHLDSRLYITDVVAGELAAGASLAARDRWKHFLAPFVVLGMNEEVWWRYGQTYRYLRDQGLLIAANDLWISAVALAYDLPLVTRNRRHFSRVPGLSVETYAG